MKTILAYLLVMCSLCTFTACKKKSTAMPEDTIDEATMLNILLEFHQAEAIAGKKGGLAVQREMLRKDLQEEILGQYGLDKETFYQSYKYYMEHPVVLDSIYSNIIQILEEKTTGEKDTEDSSDDKDSSSGKDSLPPILKKRLPQAEE
jgi:hypothetical protein